nr:hypothetical protein [Candidatus Sigynarchaeota archaeon]
MNIPFDRLLSITKDGSMLGQSMAALTLGILATNEKDPGLKARIVARLREMVANIAEPKNEMPGTLARIGLSFLEKVNNDDFAALPHPFKESAVITECMAASTKAESLVEAALASDEGNVIFGGVVGACLHAIHPSPGSSSRFSPALEKLMGEEIPDTAVAGSFAYALLHRMDPDIEGPLGKTEAQIKWGKDADIRVGNVLANVILTSHMTDRTAMLTRFTNYADAGDFARFALFAAYGLTTLVEGAPVSAKMFKDRPYLTGDLETVYHFIGMMFAFAFFSINSQEDFRAWCLKQIDDLEKDMDQDKETKFVHLICRGIMANKLDAPAAAFARLLKETYAAQFDTRKITPGTSTTKMLSSRIAYDPQTDGRFYSDAGGEFFPQVGALLGIALGIFTARAMPPSSKGKIPKKEEIWSASGLPEPISSAASTVIARGLDVKMTDVQCAAMMALLAAHADTGLFRKVLVLWTMYEVSVGDIPYFRAVSVVLATYGLVLGDFL